VRAYPTLNLADQQRLLRSIVDRAAELMRAGKHAVVVFDLDGTLLDNRPRTAAIFRELAGEWAPQHPDDAKTLAGAATEHIVYGVAGSLHRLGLRAELHAEVTDYWKARFFRDPHLSHDVPLDGAAAFVRALHELGTQIVYLTGRDLPNMSIGTWASLRDNGFPIGVVGTSLVCKPDFDTPDETFKRDVFPAVARLGDVVASFDNEPGNCNVALSALPGAVSVLLDTQHTDHAPEPLPDVVVIRDFRA
jgi:hypothetical protein